jgi:hypothetical protein
MKGIKSTEQTRGLSKILLVVFVLYGLFKLPVLSYAVSLAVAGLVYGVTGSIEGALLVALLVTVVAPLVRKNTEGFADASPSTTAIPDDTQSEMPVVPPSAVKGVASESTNTASNVNGSDPAPSFTGSSTPSPALKEKEPVAKKINEKAPPASQPADLITEDFDNSSGGLFKLGKIPVDEKGGFHIDAGSSVLNALKSLKPDQISAMTQDTKQLIETQKTLMNMLQSFKPMMSEGKEMMDTFQQMFSPAGGSAIGALQTAQDTLKKQ